MQFPAINLHYSNMEKLVIAAVPTTDSPKIPTYGLYGEANAPTPEFWIHTESIASRSQLHNWEIRQHRHESFFQILHIRSGTGDALFGSETLRLGPGMLVFVPQQVTHGFRFSRDIDGHVLTMLTARLPVGRSGSERLKQFLSRPNLVALPDDNPESAYLGATVDRMCRELATAFGARTGLIGAYLEIVLTLSASLEFPASAGDPTASRDHFRMSRLDDLIAGHFRAHRPVDFYASELGVSPTHLSRITRSQTGRSMQELLADKLLNEARRDLVFTFMTVQEIAYGLGFSDPAYFSRFFTRQTGETPRQFRERERGLLQN